MKKFGKALSFVLAGSLVLSLAGCSGKTDAPAEGNDSKTTTEAAKGDDGGATSVASEGGDGSTTTAAAEETDGKTYQIGVLQLVQHAALDAANEGFIAALDEAGISYEVDQQNAAGEQSTCQTIADSFATGNKDLILAIATPAAQAMAGAVTDVPVLITAVTDPAESGLVDTNETPGKNVTGTSDLTPVKEQIKLLKQLIPDVKTVGILYNAGEANSVIQAELAKASCEAEGLATETYTVSSSNEIQTVVDSMVGKVDVIYAPTDNMIAAGMTTVSMVATEQKIPIICGEAGMVEAGGLATYGIDYYQLGYLTGQQAVKILKDGADPATMPIEYLAIDKCELTINEEIAKTLGIDTSAAQK